MVSPGEPLEITAESSDERLLLKLTISSADRATEHVMVNEGGGRYSLRIAPPHEELGLQSR